MNLLEALNWRYATKRMNGNKVPEDQVSRILEAARLSASSMGLQPYSIFVIENEELRKKLQPAAYNQPQIAECSHLLVFAAWDDVTEKHVEDYIENMVKTRGVTAESLKGLKDMLTGFVNGNTTEQKHQWAANQTFIALGTALAAAALEKVDSSPMGGFIPEEIDKILNLREKGHKSVALMALGFRDTENDKLAGLKKVRRAMEKLFIRVN
jgi:nitroreductase / dihydropteridine reductase